MQAGDIEAGKARARLVEHHREVGAGQQDQLDAVAALQVGGDAAQVVGVGRRGLAVEDALVGLSAASTSTMLIRGIDRSGASSLMQMCGVTAGSTTVSAPARASRVMKPARYFASSPSLPSRIRLWP